MTKYRILFVMAFLASVFLFFYPVSTGGADRFDLDKVVHAVVFCLLAFFAMRGFLRARHVIIFFIVVYAGLIEYIQGAYLPLRHFDWYDITFDLVGIVLGLMLFSFTKHAYKPAQK